MIEPLIKLDVNNMSIRIYENKNHEPGSVEYINCFKACIKLINTIHAQVKSYEDYCEFDFTEHTYKTGAWKISRLKKTTVGYDKRGKILWEVKWISPMKNS